MSHRVDRVLDCSGLVCPLPVVRTAVAVKDMAVGQVLEVLATDPAAEPDMIAWTRLTGNELLEIVKDGDVFRILVRRIR